MARRNCQYVRLAICRKSRPAGLLCSATRLADSEPFRVRSPRRGIADLGGLAIGCVTIHRMNCPTGA
jgi:hypothetical protein